MTLWRVSTNQVCNSRMTCSPRAMNTRSRVHNPASHHVHVGINTGDLIPVPLR
ncbi:hypothetical protein PISMIDRAFT_681769 [Pisolithus microcarpus 441]|uniref:Uncharacterized protein n=1 Tax=Pisolithus microcarpus 441 TaxID=765257 RepID=A0A0C9ZF34_9AGAM|nr:hypothetical protein BKA83DRAFT_681769 [Pisolithus microcarpus]KIK11207.1 hypothetical protein PISMIDRAFT_690492 [Pisolithus microcarpus 441]KIK21057.1 hypothetical protein PISMIDRAFT_681769 [Pisolithus microcarpus 441]